MHECLDEFSAIFDLILLIFAGIKDILKRWNEFEIQPDTNTGFYGNR